jgi:hypothetical protein
MCTAAFARLPAIMRCLTALSLLIAVQGVTPSFAAAEAPAPAATTTQKSAAAARWFITLIRTYDKKSFCIPGTARLTEVAQAIQQYTQSHQMGHQLTTPQTIQILAQIYPCQAPATVAEAAAPKPQAGAAPVGMETIDLMRTLQNTSGHENDAVLEKIEAHSDSYPPPVLFGMARVLYRQGKLDDAIFWFNAGRLRGNFDAWRSADVVSSRAAMVALSRQMPIELRKAQFADLPKLRAIVTKVIAWDETTPRHYDQRWIDFHGVAANKTGPGDGKPSVARAPIPPEKWDDLAKQVRAQYRKDLEISIAMMSNAKISGKMAPRIAPQATPQMQGTPK